MSPFLKIGATLASFQLFGTWPVYSDLLKFISSIDLVGGIVSGPAALWDLSRNGGCFPVESTHGARYIPSLASEQAHYLIPHWAMLDG